MSAMSLLARPARLALSPTLPKQASRLWAATAMRTCRILALSEAQPRQRPRQLLTVRAATGSEGSDTVRSKIMRHVLLGAAGAAALLLSATSPQLALAHAEQPPAAAVTEVAAGVSSGVVERSAPGIMENKTPLPSPSDLSPEELANVRLFQENTPSIVNISNIVQAYSRYSTDVLNIPQGQGSGFVWDDQGHVVTNFHVIRGASQLRVALIDQSVHPAKVVGGDPSRDVAVLQLQAPPEVLHKLKPVTLGHSSNLFVGQKVLAIGNPFGLDHSMSSGIISGLNRELISGQGPGLRGMLQIDAAINPGNSGGPLLDSKGRLIGINTAILGNGTSSGVGFAIPIDTVKGLVDQILMYGRIVRPVLGVTIAPPQALRQLGLEGVLVLNAPPGSPAAAAGILGTSRDGLGRLVLGDVIVGFNGRPVKSDGDLFDGLDRCKPGERVQLEVLRRGKEKRTVTVELAESASAAGAE